MTFWDHLDVLRALFLRCLAITVVCAAVAFCFRDEIFTVVLAPQHSDFLTYRLFAALGNHVSELARVAMGGLLLPPELPLGACCVLSEKDVQKLLKCETDFASLLQTLQSHSS